MQSFDRGKKERLAKKSESKTEKIDKVNDRLKAVSGLKIKSGDARDPVSYVTDRFTASFRAQGRDSLKNEDLFQEESVNEEKNGIFDLKGMSEKGTGKKEGAASTGGMESSYQQNEQQRAGDTFLHKFSDIAFSKGNIAVGISQGKGKMLLVSAMKQTAEMGSITNEREKKLWGDSSSSRKLGCSDSTVIYNKGDEKTAVGLLVNSINSGVNTLQELKKAASGNALTDGEQSESLNRIYPFLSTRKERAMIAEYRKCLAEVKAKGGDSEDKGMLEYGLNRAQSMLQKKQAMCVRFANAADELADKVKESERELSEPSFRLMLLSILLNALEALPDESDEGGDAKESEQSSNKDKNDNNESKNDSKEGKKENETATITT